LRAGCSLGRKTPDLRLIAVTSFSPHSSLPP
jgi:hypothetical protein